MLELESIQKYSKINALLLHLSLILAGQLPLVADSGNGSLEDSSNNSRWHTEITLRLVPNPGLNKKQQKLVRYERCFEGEKLELIFLHL